MNPVATKTRLSDEQVIAQFVESLREEYAKTEIEETVGVTNGMIDTAADESNIQIVAPWDGQSLLEDADFIRVSYRELNAIGISFWIDHPPTTPFFVVVFKTDDETAFIKARVADAKPDMTVDCSSHLVNTEFDGRVDLEFIPALVAAE